MVDGRGGTDGVTTEVVEVGESEVDALIDELEASYEWSDDGPSARHDLLERLPATPAMWCRRARLILIGVDELVRAQGPAQAARVVLGLLDDATARGDQVLQARASKALSWLFRSAGDPSVALEHAVAAMSLDGDHLDAALRCRLRLALADALDESGSPAAARPRYREALEHATAMNTPWLSLVVLNNWAWIELVDGDLEASSRLVDRVEAISRQHGVPLTLTANGTRARLLHARGRSAEAITVLRRHLSEERRQTPIPAAGSWLDLAQIERETGDLDAAEASLDAADHLTTTHAIRVLEVEAIGARAELLAARGDLAGAYEAHLRFHARTLELRSAASDARAQTLHAMLAVTEARRESERYRELSYRDPLTQLFNRRHVDTDLDTRLSRGEDLAIAMVDLDHFKAVNDTCSHEAGDAVLVRLAAFLETTAAGSPGAYAARLGGEEFLLVLPGLQLEAAHAIAEILRQRIADHDWSTIAPGVPVTASIGLAATSSAARPPLDRADLLRRADHHLYAAKAGGRDRVEPGATTSARPGSPAS